MFILETVGKLKFKLSDEEARAILRSISDGEDSFIISGSYIAKTQIATIYPENLTDEIIERKSQMEGMLHDGKLVRKLFGEWVLANEMGVDDNGREVPIKIDPEYYPEVAVDVVPMPKEFREKYLGVKSGQEMIELMTGKKYEEIAKRGSGGFTHLLE